MGGWKRRRVIECGAWRRKRETERRVREEKRGREGGCLVFKTGGEKGEEKERSRQAGEEVHGWR